MGLVLLVVASGACLAGRSADPELDRAVNTASPEGASPPANADVTARAHAALTDVGARRLVTVPGYEREANTAITGVWRAHEVVAYVVPKMSVDRDGGELVVLSTRTVLGHSVDLVRGEDSTVTLARFALGPDVWLVTASAPPRTMRMTRALLSRD